MAHEQEDAAIACYRAEQPPPHRAKMGRRAAAATRPLVVEDGVARPQQYRASLDAKAQGKRAAARYLGAGGAARPMVPRAENVCGL